MMVYVLPFGESFFAWAVSTAVPAFVGILLITIAGRRTRSRYVAALTLGIFLWFFVDTIEGSGDLEVSAGYGGGASQVAMVLLFIVGLVAMFSLDSDLLSPAEGSSGRGLTVPLLVAIAVGIHGFGEGTAFGSTAYSTTVSSLLDAFGGVSGGAAYALHKMFEPMMVGALYVAFSGSKEMRLYGDARNILLLTLAFVVPSLLGAATGYFISYDATYFFALGTGTSIYAAVRLAKQVLSTEGPSQGHESLKVSVLIALGFILIYVAALLHS